MQLQNIMNDDLDCRMEFCDSSVERIVHDLQFPIMIFSNETTIT